MPRSFPPRALVRPQRRHLPVIPAAQLLVDLVADRLLDEMYGAIAKQELCSAGMGGLEAIGDRPIIPGMFRGPRAAVDAQVVHIDGIVDRDDGKAPSPDRRSWPSCLSKPRGARPAR